MKVLSLWYVYFCGYLCEMSTRPSALTFYFYKDVSKKVYTMKFIEELYEAGWILCGFFADGGVHFVEYLIAAEVEHLFPVIIYNFLDCTFGARQCIPER